MTSVAWESSPSDCLGKSATFDLVMNSAAGSNLYPATAWEDGFLWIGYDFGCLRIFTQRLLGETATFDLVVNSVAWESLPSDCLGRRLPLIWLWLRLLENLHLATAWEDGYLWFGYEFGCLYCWLTAKGESLWTKVSILSNFLLLRVLETRVSFIVQPERGFVDSIAALRFHLAFAREVSYLWFGYEFCFWIESSPSFRSWSQLPLIR